MYTEQFIRFTTATALSDEGWTKIDDYLREFFYSPEFVDVVRETRIGDGTLTEYLIGYEMDTDEDRSDIAIFVENHPAHDDRYYSIDGVPFHIDGITSEVY